MHAAAFPDGLSFTISKRSNGTGSCLLLRSLRNSYWSKLLLIFNNVVLQCSQQTLGMFRSKDYARANLWFRHTRQYACEVNDEVTM